MAITARAGSEQAMKVKPLSIKGKDGYWGTQRQNHSHEKKLQVVA
jgi:hypothetical protein